MKHLQKNNPTIGAQSFNLADKAGEDIYIYGEIFQVLGVKSISIFDEDKQERMWISVKRKSTDGWAGSTNFRLIVDGGTYPMKQMSNRLGDITFDNYGTTSNDLDLSKGMEFGFLESSSLHYYKLADLILNENRVLILEPYTGNDYQLYLGDSTNSTRNSAESMGKISSIDLISPNSTISDIKLYCNQ